MKTIGIDIGGTNIKAILLENGNVIKNIKTETPKNSPDSVATAVGKLSEQLTNDSSCPLGIACAGDVDGKTGIINADNLGFKNVNFLELLRKYTNKKVFLLQDAFAASFAERTSGALMGFKNAVYLCFGTGIGGDVTVNGTSLREILPGSCEIGHIITHADGKPCPCGNKGCYEQYAAASAVLQMTGGKYTAEDIAKGAAAGNKEHLEVWKKYIHELCIGLFNCMVIFNPECICLGGGISGAGDFLINSIKSELSAMSYYNNYFAEIKIVISKHQSSAGAIGSALYVANVK